MNKRINLKKAEHRKGATAINVFVDFGKMVHFDLYQKWVTAWESRTKGTCYTLTLEQASKRFPQYFTYE